MTLYASINEFLYDFQQIDMPEKEMLQIRLFNSLINDLGKISSMNVTVEQEYWQACESLWAFACSKFTQREGQIFLSSDEPATNIILEHQCPNTFGLCSSRLCVKIMSFLWCTYLEFVELVFCCIVSKFDSIDHCKIV